MPQTRPARAVLAVLALCAAGCFDYQEEIWVYDDHSGRVEGQVRVPAEAWRTAVATGVLRPGEIEEQCRRVAARVDGVELQSFKKIATSEYQRVYWAFSFTDAAALADLLRVLSDQTMALLPEEQSQFAFTAPDATVQQLGRLTTIDRRLPSLAHVLANADWPAHLEGHTAKFQVHAPEPIIGPLDAITPGDLRTVAWEVSLREVLQRGFDMRVSYRRPVPVAPIAGSIFALIAGVCGIWGFAYLHMARGMTRASADDSADAPAGGSSDDSWKDDSGHDFHISFPGDKGH